MTHPFAAASAWSPTAPDRWEGRFERPWFQGRGAFGGLVGAVLLRGMTAAVDDPGRRVRTLTVHFCAPAAEGEAALTTERVRAGFTVTHTAARITQGDRVVAMATATFAAGRNDPMRYADLEAPHLPARGPLRSAHGPARVESLQRVESLRRGPEIDCRPRTITDKEY